MGNYETVHELVMAAWVLFNCISLRKNSLF
jgi:hypothetical protein